MKEKGEKFEFRFNMSFNLKKIMKIVENERILIYFFWFFFLLLGKFEVFMNMKDEGDEDDEKGKEEDEERGNIFLVMVVHRYIKWTSNLMPEI